MTQPIEQRVKADYDRLPYPGIDASEVSPDMNWTWVNMGWVCSLVPVVFNEELPFKRILIAGCGTGNEAFRMHNRYPRAEITAVDYSEASIQIAQKYQSEHPHHAGIQFEVGDLTDGNDDWAKADHYDFISCHGTLSYIPDVNSVFDLFKRCLSEKGILYLGVNGVKHFGINVRNSFEYLGHSADEFEDTLETRRLIELIDRLCPQQSHLANRSSAYIVSDLLNTFSLNLPLSEWNGYAEKAGLNLISSVEHIPSMLKTLSPNIFPLLIPKSRKEICELIALNNDVPFHRLIFSKSAPAPLPWHDLNRLLNCEFQTTGLYTIQAPISDIYGELLMKAHISYGVDIDFRWPVDDLTVKLLSQREGNQRLRDVLEDSIHTHKNNLYELLVKIFMFYQLGLIKIFPDASKST